MALTPKREIFAKAIAIDGMSQADAYRKAYKCDNWTDKSIHEKASHLAADVKVRARIAEIRKEIDTPRIMSAIRRKERLTEIINTSPDSNEVMKAIDLLNKMDGEYTTKIEADVNAEVTINIELSDD